MVAGCMPVFSINFLSFVAMGAALSVGIRFQTLDDNLIRS
jgi:hypothetical protein